MAHHRSSTRNKNTITPSRNNIAIHELKDEDNDCIFVKEVTNSMSKSKGKQKIIEPRQESKYFESTNFRKNISIVNVDDDEYDDDVTIINVTPRPSSRPLSPSSLSCSSSKRRRSYISCPTIVEVGESSSSKKSKEKNDEMYAKICEIKEVAFACDICADSKPQQESFWIKGCSHYYCVDCMRNYVDSKLEGGVSQIDCPVPKCSGTLDSEHCREILSSETYFKWGRLLCESTIVASQKYYCPFKDCSALLIDDGSEKVTRSECPSCYRLFCAQCRVGWHEGIECAEFQTLNKDEQEAEGRMLMNLAKSKNWKRCPACKIYVEKIFGCNIIHCRCGTIFRYCSCGQQWCICYNKPAAGLRRQLPNATLRVSGQQLNNAPRRPSAGLRRLQANARLRVSGQQLYNAPRRKSLFSAPWKTLSPMKTYKGWKKIDSLILNYAIFYFIFGSITYLYWQPMCSERKDNL